MRLIRPVSVLFIIALAVSPWAGLRAGETGLITFIIEYPSISPNGDGVKDWSHVEVTVLETVDSLSVTVENEAGTEVYDTLIFIEDAAPATYSASWSGEDSLGTPLGEDSYSLHITASAGSTDEHYHRTLIVDLTTPDIQLDRIEPGIYTPGLEGTAQKVMIYILVTDSQAGDSLYAAVIDPGGGPEEIPSAVTGDGAYTLEWESTASATDGIHTVSLQMTDMAGNSSDDVGFVDVDTNGPSQDFTVSVRSVTNDPPDTLGGFCYDRNGVETPELSWNGGDTVEPHGTFVRNDTLFWRFIISDSIQTGPGEVDNYSLDVTCRDLLGRETTANIEFTVDLDPPGAPTVNPAHSPVYEPELSVTGTTQPGSDSIFVYRAFGDDTTVTADDLLIETFSVDVTLCEGTNRVWAAAGDEAGNRSGTSGVITVVYALPTGFNFPEVFRGPDLFGISTPSEALQVVIDIYSIDGRHVTTLRENGPGTGFQIEWDLLNDDGDTVKNGPFLVVITVHYATTKTVDKYFIAVVQ